MASPYPGAMLVGSYFVGQYYQVLQQQPELIHQFYSDPSRAIRVDGDSTETANSLLVVRKSIAQVLTVIFQKQKFALREAYKNKKFLPLDLRPKKTRAIRRRLTKHQASLKTEREKKKEMYFPVRKYAIKV